MTSNTKVWDLPTRIFHWALAASFAGAYVISLDKEHYRWSLVAGPDRNYLWILARDRTLPAEVREQLVSQAKALGFATDELIWVEQQRDDAN